MYLFFDNVEIMTNDKEDEVIKNILESFLSRYHIGLETSIRGNDFIFDYIVSLYCQCHKINLKCNGSYTDYPILIKI